MVSNIQKITLNLTILLLFLFISNIAFAQTLPTTLEDNYPLEPDNGKNVYFFWGLGCPHCENVKDNGILEEVDQIENVNVFELEVYNNQSNRKLYTKFADELEIPQRQRGVPFLFLKFFSSLPPI